jgi:hypothetical protein
MPARTAAATRSHARPAPRRSAAPRHARRVSGPARPLRPAAAAAVNAGAAAAPRALPRTRPGASTFERVARVGDHRLVDGLLRSRAWIVIVGVLLGGIVAMQVSLLKLNAGISRAVEASATLERQNADMQDRIARLSSGQRVSAMASHEGMVFPLAGDVGYLRARGARDAQLAVRRMTPPSASAAALMAAGGHAAPGGTSTATSGSAATATSAAPATATSAVPATTAPGATTAPATSSASAGAPAASSASATTSSAATPATPTVTGG